MYAFLLQRLHEENEKLFERLTQKTTLAGSGQVYFLISLSGIYELEFVLNLKFKINRHCCMLD